MGSERTSARRDTAGAGPAEGQRRLHDTSAMPQAATVLRLQSTLGNRATARRFARARRSLIQRDTTVPGRSRVLDAPPPVQGVALPPAQAPSPQPQPDDNTVRPAVDLAADARTVTVTVVLRNFNLPQSDDTSTVDFLHEPGVSIQVTPGNTPQPVVQAAIAAMNVHLRRHARELIEISLSPQASIDSNGRPSVGAQAQAEIHVTSSFSITAATSVAAAPHSTDVDPGSIRLTGPSSAVDLTWAPISIGVLFHLDAQDRPRDSGPPVDYAAAEAEGRYITWVVNQLNASDFASPGAGQLEAYEFVRQLLGVMRGASGEEAQWTIHLGAMLPNEIPTGLTNGLTRAAQIIAGTSTQFANLRRVRVSMVNLGPTRNGNTEQLVRWTLLNLESQAVKPTPSTAPSGT